MRKGRPALFADLRILLISRGSWFGLILLWFVTCVSPNILLHPLARQSMYGMHVAK
jgi:hypothetical protein